jgi:hypothetical protein
MPLQFMLTAEAMTRMNRYAEVEGSGARELVGMPVGQIVGSMNAIRSARDVIYEMVSEYVETVGDLAKDLDLEMPSPPRSTPAPRS